MRRRNNEKKERTEASGYIQQIEKNVSEDSHSHTELNSYFPLNCMLKNIQNIFFFFHSVFHSSSSFVRSFIIFVFLFHFVLLLSWKWCCCLLYLSSCIFPWIFFSFSSSFSSLNMKIQIRKRMQIK